MNLINFDRTSYYKNIGEYLKETLPGDVIINKHYDNSAIEPVNSLPSSVTIQPVNHDIQNIFNQQLLIMDKQWIL